MKQTIFTSIFAVLSLTVCFGQHYDAGVKGELKAKILYCKSVLAQDEADKTFYYKRIRALAPKNGDKWFPKSPETVGNNRAQTLIIQKKIAAIDDEEQLMAELINKYTSKLSLALRK